MKKLLVVLIFLVSNIALSQNTLELYNNTDKEIYSSYAMYDFENKCWTTKGWYKIASYSSITWDFASYTNDIYIHGFSVNPGSFWESETQNSWGKDASFCVDKNNAFTIRFADKINCDTKKNFSKYKIAAGLNKWTFNP